MTTITKPMGIERAYESAKRYVDEAAQPHKIYMLVTYENPAVSGYLIPISDGVAPFAFVAPKAVVEPELDDEPIEVIAGAILENGEPVALEEPKRRKRTPKPVEAVYYHNPYKEEPLTPELCALHLKISLTRFYKLVADHSDLKKRACKQRDLKGLRGGMRFTRCVLDRWVKVTAKNGALPLPLFGPRQTGRNLPPSERKGVTQPRCTVLNKDGSQCRGLTMKGYGVCSVHAMFATAAEANGAGNGTGDTPEAEATAA